MQLQLRASRSGAVDAEAKEAFNCWSCFSNSSRAPELKSGAQLRAGLAFCRHWIPEMAVLSGATHSLPSLRAVTQLTQDGHERYETRQAHKIGYQ